jgi:hypothetical protein
VKDTNLSIDVLGLTKYIVYQATDLNTGKIYTGRTSGADNMSMRQILNRRQRNHHRELSPLQYRYGTDNYQAVRGAEQFYIDEARNTGNATDQINGISERKKRSKRL